MGGRSSSPFKDNLSGGNYDQLWNLGFNRKNNKNKKIKQKQKPESLYPPLQSEGLGCRNGGAQHHRCSGVQGQHHRLEWQGQHQTVLSTQGCRNCSRTQFTPGPPPGRRKVFGWGGALAVTTISRPLRTNPHSSRHQGRDSPLTPKNPKPGLGSKGMSPGF